MPSTVEEQASRRINFHQSTVSGLLDCGRRAWAEVYSDLPLPGRVSAAAGTAFHLALARHEEARLAGNPDGITREQMKAVCAESIAEQAPSFTPDQLDKLTHRRPGTGRGKAAVPGPEFTGLAALVARAEDAVDNWFDAPTVDPHGDGETTCTAREWLLRLTPLAIEQYVKASLLDGLPDLAGTIDGIYWDPTLNGGRGGVRVVDAKTSIGSLSDWKKPDNHRDQAAFYSTLIVLDGTLAQVSGRLPAPELPAFTYMVVRATLGKTKAFVGAHLLDIDVNGHDVPALAERVRRAHAVVQAGVFPVNPDAKWCASWSCPIWDRCVFGDRSLAGPLDRLRLPAAS